ncbi:hypothetical protein JCGZ_10383 [Jatropha curcas]|uniref:Uncharacterized protein n=1 Tax=Jatropha curcas TaxID=180498 RepID=A0A067KU65_JATCU|nr:hypothetical protein JCGZ_10383 [Jatropha curcas]
MPKPCTSARLCCNQGEPSAESDSSTSQPCWTARSCHRGDINPRACLLKHSRAAFILDFQSLARLSRAIWHARATRPYSSVPLSTAHAHPSTKPSSSTPRPCFIACPC